MKNKYMLLAACFLCSCSNTLHVDAIAGKNLTIRGNSANLNIKKAKAGQDLRLCSDGNISSPQLKAPGNMEISSSCKNF